MGNFFWLMVEFDPKVMAVGLSIKNGSLLLFILYVLFFLMYDQIQEWIRRGIILSIKCFLDGGEPFKADNPYLYSSVELL